MSGPGGTFREVEAKGAIASAPGGDRGGDRQPSTHTTYTTLAAHAHTHTSTHTPHIHTHTPFGRAKATLHTRTHGAHIAHTRALPGDPFHGTCRIVGELLISPRAACHSTAPELPSSTTRLLLVEVRAVTYNAPAASTTGADWDIGGARHRGASAGLQR